MAMPGSISKNAGPIGHTPVKAAYLPRGPVKTAKPAKQTLATNPLYNPSATLSGAALAKAAKQIANLQVQAPINDERAQINQNNKTSATEQRTDFGYYMQLAQAAKDAVTAQQAQGSQLQSQLAGIGTQTQGQLAQLGQQAGSGALARMTALGLDAGQTRQLAADTAQQQSTGALQAQQGQTAGALQTNNLAGENNAVRGATGLAGTEAISGLSRATALSNQPLNQKIADEQSQRGALTATALGQLRTQERNYQIAEQGLASTATTNAQKLQLQQAQDNASNALKALGINTTAATAAAKLSVAQQNNLANQANKAASLAERTQNDNVGNAYRQAALNAKNAAQGGPVKMLSGGDQARLNGEITKVEGMIQQAQAWRQQSAQGILKPKDKNYVAPGANIRTLLEAHYSFPDAFVEAAYELLGYGALRPATVQILRNTYGLNATGGTFKGAPIKVKSQPTAQPVSKVIGQPVLKAIGNIL